MKSTGSAFASFKGIERLDVRPALVPVADISLDEAVATLCRPGKLVAAVAYRGILGGTGKRAVGPTGLSVSLVQNGFAIVREGDGTWTAILPAGGQTVSDIRCATLREAVVATLAHYGNVPESSKLGVEYAEERETRE